MRRYAFTCAVMSLMLAGIFQSASAQGDQDRILWRFEMDSATSGWEVSVGPDGTIYTSDDTKLYALNPDGSIKWTTTTVRNNTPVDFLPDGTLLTKFQNVIYALNPDGTTLWTFTSPGNTPWSQIEVGPSVGPDGNIYAASGRYQSSGLGAFSLTPDGEFRWSDDGQPPMAPINGSTGGPVFFTPERLIFPFAITEGARVYGYDFDGDQTLYVDFTCLGIPRTDPLGRLLLASACGVEALEQDGNEIYWRVQFGPVNLAPASGADGTAYSADWGDEVNAINPDGTIKWTSTVATDAQRFLAARQDVDRLVYSGGGFGRHDFVSGLRTEDGTLLWTVDMQTVGGLNEFVWTQRAPTSADGHVVYFTTRFASNGAPGALYAVWITDFGTPAEIDVTPLTFDLNVGAEGQVAAQLTIDNLADPVSGRVLNWSVDDFPALPNPGYTWVDSDGGGGPSFVWKDITATGTPVSLADDGSISVPLPFPFPFYGTEKTSVTISANGYLTFGTVGGTWWNTPIPDPIVPNEMIAAFWDDLSPPLGGSIHYAYDASAEEFIVQYTDISRYGENFPNSFEIILRPDGTILVQYLSMRGELNQATVGIENSDASVGTQIVYNAPYIHDGLAVLFTSLGTGDWLSANPLSGSVPVGTGVTVELVADATGLAVGTYQRNLVVSNNDPDESSITIPVTLTVLDTPASVGEGEGASLAFRLQGNHPNPFNPSTTIRYELPSTENVHLAIYDAGGRLVRVLVDDVQQGPGEFSARWDGRSGGGNRVASGVYFYRIEAGTFEQTRGALMVR